MRLVSTLVLSVTMVAVSDANACSCAPVQDSTLDEVEAAFVGRAIDTGGWFSRWVFDRVETTFEVVTPLKNSEAPRVVVEAGSHSAACGIRFEVGEMYLILAYLHDGVLRTSLCTAYPRNGSEGTRVYGLFQG